MKHLSLNPFMPSGLFYLKSLERSIYSRRAVWLIYDFHDLQKILYVMQTV